MCQFLRGASFWAPEAMARPWKARNNNFIIFVHSIITIVQVFHHIVENYPKKCEDYQIWGYNWRYWFFSHW